MPTRSGVIAPATDRLIRPRACPEVDTPTAQRRHILRSYARRATRRDPASRNHWPVSVRCDQTLDSVHPKYTRKPHPWPTHIQL